MASGHRYSTVRRSLKLSVNSELSKRYNSLGNKNKELKAETEFKADKIQQLTTKIENAHLITREARKRLDTETKTIKAEAAKIREENERFQRQRDEMNLEQAQYLKNTLNAEKMEGLRKTVEELTKRLTQIKNEINELTTTKVQSLSSFEAKNQFKEELESEIADLNQRLKTAKAAVPDTSEAGEQFKMAKTEYDREMADLAKKEKDIDQTRTALECFKLEAVQNLQAMKTECQNFESKAKEKDKQFSIWRLEAKMDLNDKENELDDLQKLFTDIQTMPTAEVTDPFHVLVAGHKAFQLFQQEKMKTRTLHSEIIFNLSPSTNINESFKKFGILDSTSNVLLVMITQEDAVEKISEVSKLINGKLVSLNALSEICDQEKIRKIYGISDEELQCGSLQDGVVTRIATKDAT